MGIVDPTITGGGPESRPGKTSVLALTSDEIRNAGFRKVESNERVIEEIASEIKDYIFGQDLACEQLALAIVRAKAGFANPNKPKSTIAFLGPTGVGKTETAKALSKQVYGNDWQSRFLRIDCSQLALPQSITKLSGSDPSYIGYGDKNMLFDAEKLDKGMVIDFDEIEKADPSIWRWLLPVMDEGQATTVLPIKSDNPLLPRGEIGTLNFRNSWLVFTSNVGAKEIYDATNGIPFGFSPENTTQEVTTIGKKELRKKFGSMPEFIDRFGDIVVFNELRMDSYVRIFDKYLEHLNETQKRVILTVTKELREFLIEKAVGSGEQGARKIGRIIDGDLTSRASEIIVSGVLRGNAILVGDIEDGEIIFWTSDVAPTPNSIPSNQSYTNLKPHILLAGART
ncbi:AAA family ATPase [Patescibacteria group bacterium]|nr:AAA family ATPase [Patescibacteria group bacterium]